MKQIIKKIGLLLVLLSGVMVTKTTTGFTLNSNQAYACGGASGFFGGLGGDLGDGLSYTTGYNGDVYLFYTSTTNIGTTENPIFATNTVYVGTVHDSSTTYYGGELPEVTITPGDNSLLSGENISLDVADLPEISIAPLTDYLNSLSNDNTTDNNPVNTTDLDTFIDYLVLYGTNNSQAETTTNESSGGGVVTPTVNIPCPTTIEDLQNAFPGAPHGNLVHLMNVLNNYGKDFGIDTKEKLQHFLAQAAQESGNFQNLQCKERLSYSTDRLLAVWPKRFSTINPTKANPYSYANNSQKLANFIYAYRMGNGSESSGDGFTYRGRGLFQLTGRYNYNTFNNFYHQKYNVDLDLINNPDILSSDPTISIISALWFYKTRVLNKISVNANTSVEVVTKKVNGGKVGLNGRKSRFNAAHRYVKCH